jgi:hypothetical protein
MNTLALTIAALVGIVPVAVAFVYQWRRTRRMERLSTCPLERLVDGIALSADPEAWRENLTASDT